MSELISQEIVNDADFLLGEILGSRRAFSSVAARCSAVEAALLRRMRDEKLFTTRSETWDEFCPQFLGMSRASANRIIGLLEEFGADYFHLAQLTRITPTEFRAIAGSVRDSAVHWDGEAIALIRENSKKIADAVDALRKTAPEPTQKKPSREKRIAALQRACAQVASEFAELSGEQVSHREKPSLWSVRAELLNRIKELELQG
jgi:hypothetical protein